MNDTETIISLLSDIRDTLLRMEKDADTLAERREKHRLVVANGRAKKRAKALHGNVATVTSQAESVTSQKGEREERKTFPPPPPIEEKEGKGEKPLLCVCACARERFPAAYERELVRAISNRSEMRSPPCMAEMLAWTHDVFRVTNKDALIRAVFNEMHCTGWTHATTGKPLGNWASFLRRCLIDNLPPKPKRTPAASSNAAPRSTFQVKRADNYHEISEEDTRALLGELYYL